MILKPYPDQRALKRLFIFDPSGYLVWRGRPESDFVHFANYVQWNAKCARRKAGRMRGDGYSYVTYSGEKFVEHRLIWIMHNGDIPIGLEIDHIDGNRLNNSLSNLRLVTRMENQKNKAMPSRNSSGVCGVSWNKRSKAWSASVRADGKTHTIGDFVLLEDASMAVGRARERLGFTARHGT